MVKPTLNPKPDGVEKDDLKKEKDIEVALKNSVVEAQVCSVVATPQPRRKRCLCCFTLMVLLFVVALATFLAFRRFGVKKNDYWCGVIYDNYPESDQDYVLLEPQSEWLYEDVNIDLTAELETIHKPQDKFSERLTIMHDYKVNLSAYHLLNSKICYVKPIDPEVIANPQEFWDSFQDPEFLNHHYEILYETYTAVEPAISDLNSLGPNLASLCQGVPTYWIEKLPPITFNDLWNIFMDVLFDYDVYSDDRVRRDVADTSDAMNNIRIFDGKNVRNMKVLQSKVINKLKTSGKLEEKYQKFIQKSD